MFPETREPGDLPGVDVIQAGRGFPGGASGFPFALFYSSSKVVKASLSQTDPVLMWGKFVLTERRAACAFSAPDRFFVSARTGKGRD